MTSLNDYANPAQSICTSFGLDQLSLLDPAIVDTTRIHGPRQLTDIYLLALAVRHRGRLVTFDESIAVDAIRGATKKHLFNTVIM